MNDNRRRSRGRIEEGEQLGINYPSEIDRTLENVIDLVEQRIMASEVKPMMRPACDRFIGHSGCRVDIVDFGRV